LKLWRTQETEHLQEGRYLLVPPSHRMFFPHMVMEDKVVDREDKVVDMDDMVDM
jgi:hypothetical protein